MERSLLLALAALSCASLAQTPVPRPSEPASPRAQPTLIAKTQWQPELDTALKAVQPKVISWRRDIHQNPELGNHETRTAALVAKHLKALGLAVETGVAHTGVVAVLKGGKPGPRIALRADMDALPVTEQTGLPFASTAKAQFSGETVGVMHACGHDGHTSLLMGVAEVLAGMKAELPGEVVFVFQPAEEGVPPGEEGGAALMLKEGLFEKHKPEAVFGLHVWSALAAGTIGVRGGPLMAAADRFDIVLTGRQTHGAKPWGGVDPIVAASSLVQTMQTLVSREQDLTSSPLIVSVGQFKGGIRFNIIPDQVTLSGTIRTFEAPVRERVHRRLDEMAQHVAAAHGAKAELSLNRFTPVTRNDPALTARMLPSLRRAAGDAARVLEIAPVTVSEDFGALADQVPGLYFFVGSTAPGVDPATAPANHSPQFTIDESALDVGVRALTQVALDYLGGTAP
jgi:amidohydrolase